MRKMRSREIVLPRNVPTENFPSAWSVSSEKKYSCSVLQLCIYSVVLVLMLGIISVLFFIGIRGQLFTLDSPVGDWSEYDKGPTPSCPTCPPGHTPPTVVCGSDGVSHPSHCHLEQSACLQARNVTAVFLGPCDDNPCKYVLCVRGHMCEVDQDGVADCLCKTGCQEACPIGQWGMRGMGCQPCLCSAHGSAGQTCHQTTGQCVCRPGHTGQKCDICPGGQVEKSGGCDLVHTGPLSESGMMSDMEVSGVIGDECLTHSDCVSNHAECVRGECHCRRGFLPSSPLLCKEDPSPCSSSPCEGGGTCEEHDGIFTCYCREGRLGKFCEKVIKNADKRVVSFHGQSYVRLKKVPNSVIRTSIKLQFRTFSSSGVLFYSSEYGPGSQGDKLEISVVNHHVQLSYNLGGGSVTISSPATITLGTWHSLHVQRYRGDGILQLDHQDPVTGQAGGSIISLYLGNYSYIGGVPNREGRVTRGLEGCVKDLKFSLQPVSLVSRAEPLLVSSHGVGECDIHPCESSPCKHRGECVTVWGEQKQWSCLCRRQFTGEHCQRRRGHCHPNPCQNGGQCHHTEETGVRCSCMEGWGGRLCDHNTNRQTFS